MNKPTNIICKKQQSFYVSELFCLFYFKGIQDKFSVSVQQ